MMRVKWFFQFLAVVLGTLPLAVLPYKISLRVGEVLGSVLFLLWKSRRTIAVRNLKEAVERGAVTIHSSPEAVIEQNFRNLGKSFVEVVKIYYGLGNAVLRRVEIKGIDHFRKAHQKGLGVLLITGHCGNWELNAVAFSMRVGKVNVVARTVDNPFLNSRLERIRERYGNGIIYKKGALKKILAAVKHNEVVGILMDQSVVRSEGIAADFLGRKDYLMKTPALIARKTGAAVLPAFIRRVTGGHMIEIGEEITLDRSEDFDSAVFSDTVNFSGYIEQYIKGNPSEWLWMHRRWKRFAKESQPPAG